MWTVETEPLLLGRILRSRIQRSGNPLAYRDVLSLWQNSHEFRTFFTGLLASYPFPAFRWETPSITTETQQRPFEFVVLDSPELTTRPPDRDAFAEHFAQGAPDAVVAFPNLGGDAVLIVPGPIAADAAYGHLASFIRNAPEAQRHALWKRVGQTVEQMIGPKPLWLSTAGAGVSWLHVRLDQTPKYYAFAPYR